MNKRLYGMNYLLRILSDFWTAPVKTNVRLKATKQASDFIFIISKQEKDIALLKVSKKTGKFEGEINLRKNRQPLYAVDNITGQVNYQIGDASLIL